MSQSVSDYYDGSRIFSPFSDYLGISVDKINFIISQLVALLLASLFRTVFHPSKTNATTRHTFGLIVGLIIGYFCFGIQAIHLALLPAICYIVIRTTKPQIMQRMVLAIALTYLSLIHLHRQIYDYGSYTLDITGPLMVITQKVTSLAFNIHDGLTKNETELSKTQRLYAIKKIPNPLEYFSFTLQFPALMAGPVMFYKDYIDFIDGNNFHLTFNKNKEPLNGNDKMVIIEPSPMLVVFKKIILSSFCALIFIKVLPLFPIQRVKDDEFIETKTFLYKFWYLIICTTLVRFKYYFAWIIADAICNNSGIGFNGYDVNGNEKWDKFSNVDIIKFEVG